MRQRRAEIAGAGIAGLGIATMLANDGWQVRIHERNDTVREVGAGIYLRTNPLRVLELLGLDQEILDNGVLLSRSQWRDGDGHLRQDSVMSTTRRQWVGPRDVVIEALEGAARRAGVEIVTGSKVIAASPSGVLRTESAEYQADLVVAADGHTSTIRGALGLTTLHRYLPTLATRFLVPDRDIEPEDQTTMYWSGRRRVGVTACGRAATYIYLITPEDDQAGRRIPVAAADWSASFPVLGTLFDRLAGLPAIQHNYVVARCSAWSAGRVAVIGDAAHALPPVLGQGAGLALSNSWALVRTLSGVDTAEVPGRLRDWERDYRRYADTTQTWSLRLDKMTSSWPRPLLPVRARALSFIGNTRAVQKNMRMADGFPIALSDAG